MSTRHPNTVDTPNDTVTIEETGSAISSLSNEPLPNFDTWFPDLPLPDDPEQSSHAPIASIPGKNTASDAHTPDTAPRNHILHTPSSNFVDTPILSNSSPHTQRIYLPSPFRTVLPPTEPFEMSFLNPSITPTTQPQISQHNFQNSRNDLREQHLWNHPNQSQQFQTTLPLLQTPPFNPTALPADSQTIMPQSSLPSNKDVSSMHVLASAAGAFQLNNNHPSSTTLQLRQQSPVPIQASPGPLQIAPSINKSRRRSNTKKQTSNTRVRCSLCPETLKGKVNADRHKRLCHPATPNKYPCAHCTASYDSKGSRTIHVKNAHPEKLHPQQVWCPIGDAPRGHFVCGYSGCPKSYPTSSNLKRHVEMHHLKIRHPCPHCGYAATTKYNLKVHVGKKHREVVR